MLARCQKIEYFSLEILVHLYAHGASRSLLKVTTPTPAHPLRHNRVHTHRHTLWSYYYFLWSQSFSTTTTVIVCARV